VSLGAGMLGNYAARKGKANPLVAQVGIGCAFDKKFIQHITTYSFGLFDYVLGFGVKFKNKHMWEEFDRQMSKKRPDICTAPAIAKAKTLSKGLAEIAIITGGYKSYDHFLWESDVTPRMHKISKPFFFLSALDDPFFGSKVIPIDHCYDQILIGTT